MNKNKLGTLFVAMLILGVAFTPAVCAAEENDFQRSLLKFNDSGKKKVITSEFSINSHNGLHNIQNGSIVHYSSDGRTTVFDSEGKQSFFAIAEETGNISTPSGMKAATHVFEVPSGSEISTKENITNVYQNGVKILTVINDDNKKTETIPAYTGWLEYSVDRNVDDLSMFRADWIVPSEPSNPDDDAINFLFNAIVPYGESGIIQPVLEWNQAGSDRWTGASWSGANGVYFHSNRINVDAGDTIEGLMLWDDYHNRWYIGFEDVTDNNFVYIYSTDADDTNLDVFTTLETYNVDDNADLPSDTTFYNMLFKDENDNTITVYWDEKYGSGIPSAINGLDVVIYSSSQVKLRT
ncbi:MAG: hypothetical protein AWU58_1651 [Methanohalophilus sp. T328-1]|jgi:hypothetical protein|uniref:hypothetical protein n=1 Tax=Methanohalophilus sp. WG1-DM TaxID=2491675 RepID=UPI00079412B4|nr:hypothetical protein [Methanohalophilus sp. WG1-DM]KXS41734.1 MAG: hypothetical protein AWU58_1651 [Methanohalophilus sp. T328-1]RXG33559.1 hypothetical protein CI957_1792 [Methanohalophilus sp. WG1-DM]